ncbi:acylneuraminate cytidylyltransferase family protein [Litorivicinus sp.]|nr:acylneuraminate cytidylyltransferase family protein [Litorivicinus sp.]
MPSKFEDAKNHPKIAIIPARGGSKRVKNKNIRKINGRSLIERSIDAALGADLSVIFSSDSLHYCEAVKKRYGTEVDIDLRPASLAGDKVKVVELIKVLLDARNLSDDEFFSVLLPTSPFRDATLLCEMLEKSSNDETGYFSACSYDFPVQFGFTLGQKGVWQPLFEHDSPMVSGNTRSQDQLTYLHPTGGFYIQRVGDFKEKTSLYHNARAFVIDKIKALDVDTETDFALASAIAKEMNI